MAYYSRTKSVATPDEELLQKIYIEILGFTEDSIVCKALKQAQIGNVFDLISLQQGDVDRLRFKPTPRAGHQARPQELPLGHRNKLKSFIRWIRELARDNPSLISMDPNAWDEITTDAFNDYRMNHLFDADNVQDISMIQDCGQHELYYMHGEDDDDGYYYFQYVVQVAPQVHELIPMSQDSTSIDENYYLEDVEETEETGFDDDIPSFAKGEEIHQSNSDSQAFLAYDTDRRPTIPVDVRRVMATQRQLVKGPPPHRKVNKKKSVIVIDEKSFVQMDNQCWKNPAIRTLVTSKVQ
jgi:hypothetical protein